MKVYVTYQEKPSAFVTAMTGAKTKYYAIKCHDYDQAREIATDVCSLDGVTYVRINQCGHLKHKDTIITDGDEYWKKMYGIEGK